jgi:hypothetical protein
MYATIAMKRRATAPGRSIDAMPSVFQAWVGGSSIGTVTPRAALLISYGLRAARVWSLNGSVF